MPSFCKVCGDIMKGPKCKCGATMGTSGNADTFESDGSAPVHTQYTDAYVSTGLMKGLDDGLRRMADVRPEWVDKICCNCNRACTEGAIEGPYGTSEQGKAFCKPCFDKNFAKGECANCHDPVYSFDNQKWVKHEGKVYHDVCYNQERRCHVCRKPILGGAVNALGRDYCEGCFQCGGCQVPFKGGSFFEFHGAPYCRKCLDEAKATNKGVITKTVQKQDPRIDSLNAKVYERQGELNDLKKFQHVSIGDKCSKCKEEIISNAVTVGTGILFHPECFTCSVCNKGFPDMTFAEKNGLVYHGDCLNKTTADKCAGCAQPITKGKHLVYEGKKYHADCFTCGNCKKSLAGIPFGESKGKNLCEGCLNSESKVSHGDYKPGFTVNPISGQKEQRGAGGVKLGAKPAGLGQGNECPGCHKAVFMSEQVMGPMGSHWHRACLKCNGCGKALDSMAQQKNDTVYCRDCAKKY